MEEKKNRLQTNLIATLYNTFASSIKSRMTFEDLKPESMKEKAFLISRGSLNIKMKKERLFDGGFGCQQGSVSNFLL